jgi:hypothetical protein
MQQVILAGLIAGALSVGQSPAASAQATSGQATPGQTTPGQTTPGQTTTGQGTTGAGSGAQGTTTQAPKTTAGRAQAAAGATSLGSVRLTRAVKANGQPLAAGSYTVRLTEEQARPDAKGQDPSLERWVEFLQGSQVKGREVVTIVPESDIAQVSDGKRVPKGSARVEMLKGNDYVRVWINRGGNNYLIHLPPA